MPSGKITLKVSRASAELLGETHERTGALVVGRRLFDLARRWGGRHPMMDLPVFVVTHSVSREWVYEGSPSPSSRTASKKLSSGRGPSPATRT